MADGLDRLALPGQGDTLGRWRALAAVGASDLGLAKIFEGHTDALAILAELAPDLRWPADAAWGVWASEGPESSVAVVPDPAHAGPTSSRVVTLSGSKAWCSGAAELDHALVTARCGAHGRQLCAVSLSAAGVRVEPSRWQAVGMAASGSFDVHFDGAAAVPIGATGAYLERPGFWHGGAGVAACWYGAACTLADALRKAAADARDPQRQTLRLLALGRVTLALAQGAELLRATARAIDAKPLQSHESLVRRARLAVDASARVTLDETLRALGPGPFCREPMLARMAADLPIFLRQCHGDPDLVQLGHAALQSAAAGGEPLLL